MKEKKGLGKFGWRHSWSCRDGVAIDEFETNKEVTITVYDFKRKKFKRTVLEKEEVNGSG